MKSGLSKKKKKGTESRRKCWRKISGRMVDEYYLNHHMGISQIINKILHIYAYNNFDYIFPNLQG